MGVWGVILVVCVCVCVGVGGVVLRWCVCVCVCVCDLLIFLPSIHHPPVPQDADGTSVALAAAADRLSGSKRARLSRCGSCIGCTRGDCGDCKNCRDKPKFGGPGIKKQVHRPLRVEYVFTGSKKPSPITGARANNALQVTRLAHRGKTMLYTSS